jgi:transcriptional regulator with XRE-family HTH domain
MATAGELVCAARLDAGLSCRGLAERAGVTASTVSRIEQGTMDPTLTMLRRLLSAGSKRLAVDSVDLADGPSVARLALEAMPDSSASVDWTALRGFVDWARRHPDRLAEALEDPPARTGTALDALLASLTEELCDRNGLESPRWTTDVPGLSEPWEPEGTPRMRERARNSTPATFRARNLTVAAEDIFRDLAPT